MARCRLFHNPNNGELRLFPQAPILGWMRSIKEAFSFIGETVKIVLLALVIIVPVRMFLFQPFFVRGASMEPTFHNGDYLIIDELSYRFRAPRRGEVVVFRFPSDPSQFYIKRILGLPGETVRISGGKISVGLGANTLQGLEEAYLSAAHQNGGDFSPLTLGPDEYFMLGDNRGASSDSRRWGALDKDLIVGRAIISVWPLQDFAVLAAPSY